MLLIRCYSRINIWLFEKKRTFLYSIISQLVKNVVEVKKYFFTDADGADSFLHHRGEHYYDFL